jgi:hypothetical protein
VIRRTPTRFRAPRAASFRADGERQVSGTRRLWFRNGARRNFCGTGINGKFTANQIDVYFCKFLRFKDVAETRDLSRAAIEEPDCEINRNGNKELRGREMFFLLRMAFWLGLVLVLLPRDKTPESDKLPQLGASEAVSAATAAVSDMSQFCKRQPAACEVGGQAATVIGQRAQAGARKLYQIITDKHASDHTGAIGDVSGINQRDTLTPDDLEAEWRLPAPDTTAAN